MFLLVDFLFLDYQENIFMYTIKEILLMCPLIYLGILLLKKPPHSG